MSAWGALLGGLTGAGAWLAAVRVRAVRHPTVRARVMAFVHGAPVLHSDAGRPVSAAAGVFGPLLRSGAVALGRLLGGAASVRRRLERAGSDRTVHEIRVEQLLWGLVAFGFAAAYGLLRSLREPAAAPSSAVICLVAFASGVLARDHRLSAAVAARERRVVAEFPSVAELLALAVAAGEGPVLALERVVRRSGGELSADLGRVLAEVRTGTPVGAAFDRLATRTGVPLVARFAAAVAVAVERGTPLADLLHAQAADVREAGRRQLIEVAARKEVVMMVPVVFLVLPVTVVFAFYPGVLGLHLTTL